MYNLLAAVFVMIGYLLGCSGCREHSGDSEMRRNSTFGSFPDMIAHAGGQINGLNYTNSLEALNENYAKGFRVFELDFKPAADGVYVVAHDWGKIFRSLYRDAPKEKPTSNEFMKLHLTEYNLTQMDLPLFSKWMEEHPDAYIITDFKGPDFREFLEAMAPLKESIRKRLVIQIYKLDEYKETQNFNYPNVIFTTYRHHTTDEEIADLAKNNPLFALSIGSIERSLKLRKLVKPLGVRVYNYTVDEKDVYQTLLKKDLAGVYTDFLVPDEEQKIVVR